MAHVLLLGPDRKRATGLRTLLARDGHTVTWLRSVRGWAVHEREVGADLVVAAVGQAEPVLAEGGGPNGKGFPAPLLLVQQETDFPSETESSDRLVDRLASPYMVEEFLGRVEALVRVRRLVSPAAEPQPERAARRISSWFRSRLPERERPSGAYAEVAARVAAWADRRDPFAPGHAERVTSFCSMIAEELQMGEQETAELLEAAMLHDVGKVVLPVETLQSPAPLGEEQRRMIRTHPARGAALLRALDRDERVARVVLYHHERPDGRGYYGKDAQGVPRAAFALAVAEAYDAMTSCQLGERLTPSAALRALTAEKGRAFDARAVEALVEVLEPRVQSIPLSRV